MSTSSKFIEKDDILCNIEKIIAKNRKDSNLSGCILKYILRDLCNINNEHYYILSDYALRQYKHDYDNNIIAIKSLTVMIHTYEFPKLVAFADTIDFGEIRLTKYNKTIYYLNLATEFHNAIFGRIQIYPVMPYEGCPNPLFSLDTLKHNYQLDIDIHGNYFINLYGLLQWKLRYENKNEKDILLLKFVLGYEN